MDFAAVISQELKLHPRHVANTIALLDDGNTIPFIARYRKEATGEMDEEKLRVLAERLNYLRNLEARKEEIMRLIEEQGKLTPELAQAIKEATKLQEVEDLYRPYRQKKRTRATIAREKGLEPLANIIWEQTVTGDIDGITAPFINPELGVNDVNEALAGARDIIAEIVSDDPAYRKILRQLIWESVIITSQLKESEDTKKTAEVSPYKMYFAYKEPLAKIPPHRVLAMNRGEREGVLKLNLDIVRENALDVLKKAIIKNADFIFRAELEQAIEDGFVRLLFPSLEREVRSYITENAEEHAIKIFGLNLRNLLMQSPIKNCRVMGIDPGYRTGCKVAVVDETGKLLEHATVYPHPPQAEWENSLQTLKSLVEKHDVQLIAIGNGTASRETEKLAAELIHTVSRSKLAYCIVNEAGASVYSASKLAKEELPDLDVSMRGAVSIARRIQDPLAELVKIDPKSIGVGLYQHDVNQKRLAEVLGGVVESCVNYVGVDLNTASSSLLQYVAGLQPAVAKNIVAFREARGKFKRREELKEVKRLGELAFTQAAGFLRIADGDNPLDNTSVHPESYPQTTALLQKLGYQVEDLRDKSKLASLRETLKKINISEIASELNLGEPTLRDIIEALGKPGRDPREDMPKPIFRTDIMTLEDLRPGMILPGTVRNVVDFGAFVDIGVKQDGLIHISEISERYIKHPSDVLAVGDNVEVKVLEVDLARKRIALSLKK